MKFMLLCRIASLILLSSLLVSCGGGDSDDKPPPFPDPTTPIPPKNLELVEVSARALRLEWDSPLTSVNKYKLYRDGALIATLDSYQREYKDMNLDPDSNYSYQYAYVKHFGDVSPLSEALVIKTLPIQTVVPLNPGSAWISRRKATTLEVSWHDSSNNEEGFKVYRSGALVGTVGFGKKNWTSELGLNADTSYTYLVKSFNDAGESSGITVSGVTLHPAVTPASPVNVSTSTTTNSITLHFSDVATNEDGYMVIVNGGSKVFCDGQNISSCTVDGLSSAVSYSLDLRAFTMTEVSSNVFWYLDSPGVVVTATTQ